MGIFIGFLKLLIPKWVTEHGFQKKIRPWQAFESCNTS